MKAEAVLLAVLMSLSLPVRAAVKPAPGKVEVHTEETQGDVASAEEDEDEDEEDEQEGDSAEVSENAAAPAAVAAAESEEDDEEAGSTLTASASAPQKAWGGWLDLRPSWSGSEQRFHSENELALEYRANRTQTFGYTQEFRSNLLKAGVDSDTNGFEFQLWNGYLWGSFDEVLSSAGGTLTLAYEPRLYFPTLSTDRDAGLAFATRQYLKLNWEVLPNVSLFLWDAPIAYVYTVGGIEDEEGAYANKVFENRVEMGVRMTFFQDALTVKLPLILQSERYRHFLAGAENDDAWAHSLWINPEITYQVAENTTLGVAYYSDTLSNDKLTEPDISNGLRKGIFQLVFTQSI